MKMRRLVASDYDELLDMLNSVFARKYGRAMDFLSEQPRMWVRSDEFMNKHIGIFDGERLAAVVGVYPLPTRIAGSELLFATTGNVATRPEYEGRGYFTKLFAAALEEADRLGVHVARLGGARQRYGRFGFEPAGTGYRFSFGEATRVKFFADLGADIDFDEVMADDVDTLEFCRGLRHRRAIHVEREARDEYAYLGTKHSRPYVARRGGEPIGYLCSYSDGQFVGWSENGRHVSELCALSEGLIPAMLCAWQRRVGGNIDFHLPPYMKESVRLFSRCAESVTVTSPSMFRVRDFERLADALMRLKSEYAKMPSGECVVGIEGYGNLRLYALERAGAERTDGEAEICLTASEATRLLFGHLAPEAVADVPDILRLWLPLPLAWDGLDYV